MSGGDNVQLKQATVRIEVVVEVSANYGNDWQVKEAHRRMAEEAVSKLKDALTAAKMKHSYPKVLTVSCTSDDA